MSARSEALNILYRIMHDDGYASLIMRESKIKKEEMASVTNIVYGVLRNYTYLEYQWRKYAKRTKLKTIFQQPYLTVRHFCFTELN